MLRNLDEQLSSVEDALIPYTLIRYLASHPDYWRDFLKIGARSSKSVDTTTQDSLTTSCANTLHALFIIFLGEEAAQKEFARLHKFYASILETHVEVINTMIGTGWKIYHFLNNNVLNAGVASELKQDGPNPLLIGMLTQLIMQVSQIPKPQRRQDWFNVLSNLDHDFNQSTLSALQEKIIANKAKAEKKTQLYFVTIVAEDKKNKGQSIIQHEFLIEQFSLGPRKEIRYRIYQSWARQATLEQDFKKRGYGEKGENALNEKQMFAFLKNLSLYCSTKKSDSRVTASKCFGYEAKSEERYTVDTVNKTITGPCVRFLSAEIDPKECINHFKAFLKAHTDFKFEQESTLCKELKQPDTASLSPDVGSRKDALAELPARLLPENVVDERARKSTTDNLNAHPAVEAEQCHIAELSTPSAIVEKQQSRQYCDKNTLITLGVAGLGGYLAYNLFQAEETAGGIAATDAPTFFVPGCGIQ